MSHHPGKLPLSDYCVSATGKEHDKDIEELYVKNLLIFLTQEAKLLGNMLSLDALYVMCKFTLSKRQCERLYTSCKTAGRVRYNKDATYREDSCRREQYSAISHVTY